MCFESSERRQIKKRQSTRYETEKFLKGRFEVSIKTFYRKTERKTRPKRFFIFKQLEKYRNKYYHDKLNLKTFAGLTPYMFFIFLLKNIML